MRALVLLVVLAATPAAAETARWSARTARTLPQGTWELGVFSPLRYGLTDSLTLTTYPVWNGLIPNLAAKYALSGAPEGHALAVSGSLTVPTPLLHFIAREGTGGLLAPEPSAERLAEVERPKDLPDWNVIPFIVAAGAHMLWTAPVAGEHLVTTSAGVRLAAPFGPMRLSTLDHHLGYARTAVYSTFFTADAGVSLEGPIRGPFFYRADLAGFVLPFAEGRWTLEHSASLFWRPTPGFQMMLGYKVFAAELPYGFDLSPPFPMIDAAWTW